MPELVTCLLLKDKEGLPEEVIDVMKADEWLPIKGKSIFVLKWPQSIENDPDVLEDVMKRLISMRSLLKGMGIRHTFSTMEIGDRSRVKMKICLVGDKGVGKSSLIRRYVLDQFDDDYLRTMGSKVSKKTIVVKHPEDDRKIRVDMTLWDIMGNKGLASLLMNSYIHGAQGIIAVCDVTRRSTLKGLEDWIDEGVKVAGDVPVHILVNKADMHNNFNFDRSEVEEAASPAGSAITFASARTGDNVEEAFRSLAMDILSTEAEAEKVLVEVATA